MQKPFSSHLNHADLLTFGLGETEGKQLNVTPVGSLGKHGEGFSGDGREMGQGERRIDGGPSQGVASPLEDFATSPLHT